MGFVKLLGPNAPSDQAGSESRLGSDRSGEPRLEQYTGYIEAEVAKLGARGWFGPRMFTRHTEHRRDGVIAKRHHRLLVFPARTRDVHVAVDDDI